MQPRIVLYGPPLAGKLSIIKEIAKLRGLPLQRSEMPCGPQAMNHVVVSVQLPKARGQLLTLPGGVWDQSCWDALLDGADAIILVLDSQEVRDRANRECVDVVEARVSSIRFGCIALTKRDLVAPGSSKPLRSKLAASRVADWPSFETRIDNMQAMLEPFNYIISKMDILC